MTEATIKRDKQSIGLWKAISKKGNAYLRGSSDCYWIAAFKNTLKEQSNEPDTSVKFTPKDKNDPELSEYGVGLFKKTSKNGFEYAHGKRGVISYALFPNTRKVPGSNQPDYNLSIEIATTGSQPLVYNTTRDSVNQLPAEEEQKEEVPAMEQESMFDDDDDDFDIPF